MHAQERLLEVFEASDKPWARRHVRFLLGTDEMIPYEARVALTPRHVERLAKDLGRLGIDSEIAVISGAGDRARPAFSEEDYRAAGAQVVSLETAARLPAFDVLHALKEPTDYEATLAGPMLRIGALHLASKPPGLCSLLQKKNFAAILDGATVGNCSYLLEDGDRTPIVGSMSRFAGAVAGKKVVEAVRKAGIGPGKVVVVGGGIAGRSAIRQVLPIASELVVIEPWEPMRERLAGFFAEQSFEDFRILPSLDDETVGQGVLADAIGLVFAHRSGAQAAEKVCRYEQIRTLRPGAAISDIAIDQGGSIAHANYDEADDAVTARAKYIELLGEDFSYYAEVNMPREEPRAASEEHGDASLPYITALLALVAREGSAIDAAQRILERPVRIFTLADSEAANESSYWSAILQDLRNGVQLALIDDKVEITDPDIERSSHLASWIRACADKD